MKRSAEEHRSTKQAAVQKLREMGIQVQLGKAKAASSAGQRRLRSLASCEVALLNGSIATVPRVLHSVCSMLLRHVQTEGLFRRNGSVLRQKAIQEILESGGAVDDSHHAVDLARVLATFLRSLAEPVVPWRYHGLLVACRALPSALQLASLLLPLEHQQTLAYLCEFLQTVAGFSAANRMDEHCLAVVMMPSLMPTERLGEVEAHIGAVEALIGCAASVGVLPEGLHLVDSLPSGSLVARFLSGSLRWRRGRKRRGLAEQEAGPGKKPRPEEDVPLGAGRRESDELPTAPSASSRRFSLQSFYPFFKD